MRAASAASATLVSRKSENEEFETHHKKLTALVARRLGPGDAEDIVADAFLHFLEHRVDRAPIECPRAYLVAMTKNLVYGEIRRRIRQRRLFEPLDASTVERPSGDSPPAKAALLELDGLLSRLGELDSHVLLLRSEGFDVSHVAKTLGISQATVQRRVASARRFLRHSASRNALLADFVPSSC